MDDAPSRDVALRLADAPRWTDVLAREAREGGGAIAARSSIHCMMPADDMPADCAGPAWRAGFQALRPLPALERVFAVQARVNQLPYVSDLANWGMADRWETPVEMFARGGDCEDFALTKYFVLRDLGVAEGAMRLAIVWDNDDKEQHAVLFVEVDGQSWVLDNKFAEPVPAARVAARYRMIWSVNRAGALLSASAGEGEGGPRMRLARGGKMLVLGTRPIRRDQAPAMPRIEIAPAGQGDAGPSFALARIGAAVVATGLHLHGPAEPLEPVTPRPEPALRSESARVEEIAAPAAGK